VKPCPACNADAGKPRLGALGESRGVWCAACGHSLDSVEEWESAYRGDPNHVWGAPKTDYVPPEDNATRKLFHARKHGSLIHTCPGLDLLPLVDVDAIPDDQLGVVLHYLYDEVWTSNSTPEQKRDRLRALVT
jgi:hypothetical protein